MVNHGHWDYVCDDGFNKINAQSACYTLGLNGGSYQTAYSYSSSFLLDGVTCASTTTNFLECSHAGWGNHDCGNNFRKETILLTCT